MAVSDSVDPAGWFAGQIGACEPDLLRSMVKTMAEALMSAEADAVCGAGYGERSQERTNWRVDTAENRLRTLLARTPPHGASSAAPG
jgi:transposase-like protein